MNTESTDLETLLNRVAYQTCPETLASMAITLHAELAAARAELRRLKKLKEAMGLKVTCKLREDLAILEDRVDMIERASEVLKVNQQSLTGGPMKIGTGRGRP